jgi:hypothetical protein
MKISKERIQRTENHEGKNKTENKNLFIIKQLKKFKLRKSKLLFLKYQILFNEIENF